MRFKRLCFGEKHNNNTSIPYGMMMMMFFANRRNRWNPRLSVLKFLQSRRRHSYRNEQSPHIRVWREIVSSLSVIVLSCVSLSMKRLSNVFLFRLPEIISFTVRFAITHKTSTRFIQILLTIGTFQTACMPLKIGWYPQDVLVVDFRTTTDAQRDSFSRWWPFTYHCCVQLVVICGQCVCVCRWWDLILSSLSMPASGRDLVRWHLISEWMNERMEGKTNKWIFDNLIGWIYSIGAYVVIIV